MLLHNFQRRGLFLQSTYLRRRRRHWSQGLAFKMQRPCLQLTVSWRKAMVRPKPLRPQSIPLLLCLRLSVPHQMQAWQFLSSFVPCFDSIATHPCQIFCLNFWGISNLYNVNTGSFEAQQRLIHMFQKGQVDAATAMKLLAEMSSSPQSEAPEVPPKGDSKKRARSPESELDTDEDDDMDTHPGNILETLTICWFTSFVE